MARQKKLTPKEKAQLIDRHVGGRMRQRREWFGITQMKVADQLDLTFQQIQKYEKGTNRISAGKLCLIAQLLEVDINYFFEDLPRYKTEDQPLPLVSAEALRVAQQFDEMPQSVRKHLIGLVRSMHRETM